MTGTGYGQACFGFDPSSKSMWNFLCGYAVGNGIGGINIPAKNGATC
jgi:hypothetical protein